MHLQLGPQTWEVRCGKPHLHMQSQPRSQVTPGSLDRREHAAESLPTSWPKATPVLTLGDHAVYSHIIVLEDDRRMLGCHAERLCNAFSCGLGGSFRRMHARRPLPTSRCDAHCNRLLTTTAVVLASCQADRRESMQVHFRVGVYERLHGVQSRIRPATECRGLLIVCSE